MTERTLEEAIKDAEDLIKSIPFPTCNVNTVQDACKRLRWRIRELAAYRVSGDIHDDTSAQRFLVAVDPTRGAATVDAFAGYVREWIAHANRPVGCPIDEKGN